MLCLTPAARAPLEAPATAHNTHPWHQVVVVLLAGCCAMCSVASRISKCWGGLGLHAGPMHAHGDVSSLVLGLVASVSCYFARRQCNILPLCHHIGSVLLSTRGSAALQPPSFQPAFSARQSCRVISCGSGCAPWETAPTWAKMARGVISAQITPLYVAKVDACSVGVCCVCLCVPCTYCCGA